MSSPRSAPTAGAAGAVDLLLAARRSLLEAGLAPDAGGRYAAAHLAALRSAAAVLAVRAHRSRRAGPRNVWSMVPAVAPEFGEWAAYFAAGATKRAAAEAGVAHAVTAREADDLLRDAEIFVRAVTAALRARGAICPPDQDVLPVLPVVEVDLSVDHGLPVNHGLPVDHGPSGHRVRSGRP